MKTPAKRIILWTSLIALVLAGVPAWAEVGTLRNQCGKAQTFRRDDDPARITIPVVVHYMKHRKAQFRKDVARAFPPKKLKKLFPPGGGVNAIWKQAGIRLVLQQIEECEYALADFDFDGPEMAGIGSPLCDKEGLLRKINGAFSSGKRALDLYIWWQIEPDYGGYGAAYRKEVGGAVWLTSQGGCKHQCEKLVAHEIGHFLGLCHSCNGEERECEGLCEPTHVSCKVSGTTKNQLMRADIEGTRLTKTEIHHAKQTALELVSQDE